MYSLWSCPIILSYAQNQHNLLSILTMKNAIPTPNKQMIISQLTILLNNKIYFIELVE